MKKTKKIIIILFLLNISIGYGQVNIKKSSVSTVGGSATVGSTSLTYAIGEVAVQENTQGNTHLSEGFIGPDILQALGVEEFSELQGVKIYPNPVADYIHIDLSQSGNYRMYLFDLNGKLINDYQTVEDTYDINVENLQAAVYLLIIVDNEHKLKSMLKIQKL